MAESSIQAQQASEAQPASRFYISIEGLPRAVFTEANGLGVETTVEDVEEGVQSDIVHRLPARTRLGNITFKRGLTNSNEFLKWIVDATHGKVDRRNLSVVVYGPDGTELMRWNYTKAYPVQWSGPSLKSDDTNMAIESLEIAHEGFSAS